MAKPPRPSRTVRTIVALDHAADRPWFLPAVSFFPLADYALWFLPNQMLLVTLSVLQPKRWLSVAFTFVLASAVGALLIALAVQAFGPWLLDTFLGGQPDQASELVTTIERYGLAALVLLAALPWPPRTAVLICALAGLPPFSIALGVAVGRVLPSSLSALLGAKAPHLLRRLSPIDRLLRQVEAQRYRTS